MENSYYYKAIKLQVSFCVLLFSLSTVFHLHPHCWMLIFNLFLHINAQHSMMCTHRIVPFHSSSNEHPHCPQHHATTNNPVMNIPIFVLFWTCKEFVLYYLGEEFMGYRVCIYLMGPSHARLLSRSDRTSLAALQDSIFPHPWFHL